MRIKRLRLVRVKQTNIISSKLWRGYVGTRLYSLALQSLFVFHSVAEHRWQCRVHNVSSLLSTPTRGYRVQLRLCVCLSTLYKENGLSYQHQSLQTSSPLQALGAYWPWGQKVKVRVRVKVRMDQRPIILVTQLLRCDAVEVFIDVKNVFCFSLILATFLHF